MIFDRYNFYLFISVTSSLQIIILTRMIKK